MSQSSGFCGRRYYAEILSDDNITTEILANNESDMIQVYPENISTYHAIREDGTFIDLSEYMSDDLKEKLVGQDMCDVDGETLAISSYAWGTTGIFYRKSMLEDAGIDPESIKTQEDFRDTAWQYGVPTTRKVSRILRPWPPA